METVGYKKTKTVEMTFMRRTAGYSSLGHRRYGNILGELKVETVHQKFSAV